MENLPIESADEQIGVDIVKRALRTPCSTIASNAGVDAGNVVDKVLQAANASEGYDALNDRYVDMIKEGLLAAGAHTLDHSSIKFWFSCKEG